MVPLNLSKFLPVRISRIASTSSALAILGNANARKRPTLIQQAYLHSLLATRQYLDRLSTSYKKQPLPVETEGAVRMKVGKGKSYELTFQY